MRLDHLPPAVATCIQVFHRRKRLYQGLRVLLSTVLVGLALAFLTMHVDRFLFLNTLTRQWMTAGVAAIAALWALAGAARFLLQRTTPREVAYELERHLPPTIEERFVSLDDILARRQFVGNPVAEDLVAQLTASTIGASAGLRPARLVRDRSLRVQTAALLGACLLGLVLAVPRSYEFPLMVERFLFPGRNLPKPSFLKIRVTPETLVVGKGAEMVLQAEIAGDIPRPIRWLLTRFGVVPSRCTLAIEEAETGPFDFNHATRVEMSRLLRNTYIHSQSALEKSFRFRIRCGDAETRTLTVEVVPQPRILDVTLVATSPAYTGLGPQTITDVRQPLRFLPGTQIRLSFRTDQAVAQRELVFDKPGETVQPEWDEETRTGSYEFTLAKKVTFEIKVVNARGFPNVERTRISVGLREDLPPSVRLEYPTSDLTKVPNELIPLQAVVEDDFGLTEVAMRYVLNPSADAESAPREIPVPLEKAGETRIPVSAGFDLEKTGAVPGDTVAVHLRARDSAGNDGTSREILIRVMSFTRGENERQRLIALGAVTKALEEIAGSQETAPAQTARPGTHVSQDRAEKAIEHLKKAGLPVPSLPAIDALLDLMEKEHHFTDAPRHKDHIRFLYLAVLEACTPLSDPPEGLIARRSLALQTLARTVLPPLTRFRRAKNLTWRFFGMRSEVLQIHQKLDESSRQKGLPTELAESLQRRAKLYLKTLQDLGDELIRLSEEIPSLQVDKIRDTVGEMNTAGFFLGRGSAKSRQESCDKISGIMLVLIEDLRSTFPKLLEEERQAELSLQAGYATALSAIARSAPSLPAPAPWVSHASAWLAADARLADRNPFQLFWPRFLTLAVHDAVLCRWAAALGQGPRDPPQQPGHLPSLLQPAAPLHQAITAEEAHMARLSLQSEAAAVLAIDDISTTERLLECAVIRMEAAARCPSTPPDRRAESATHVLKIPLHPERLDLPEAVRSLGEWPPVPAEFHDAMDALAQKSREFFAIRPLRSMLDQATRQMNESGEEIRKLAAMTRTGAPENCLRDLAALEQKLVFEAAWRDHILHALYVLLCGPAQTEPQARELETLLLALRDSSVRYTSRTRPLLESIQEIRNKEVGSGELASLQSDLTRLDFLHESFRQRVGKLDSQDQQEAKPEEKTAEAEKYVLLKTFDETRRFLEVSRQLIVGKPGDAGEKALATEFLAQFEEAGRIYLASKAGVCLSAVKALTEAKEALTGAAPRPEILSDRLPAATAALDEVRQAAARVTADDQTGRIATTSADMLARIHRLSTEKPPKAPAEIQRHIFALDGLLKDATKLAGDLRKIDETDEGDLALRGGPDGIGASEYRIPAETAQARLQEQVRSARRTLSRGILEALEPKPDRTRYQESYAWSVFLHRVLRSGLSGVGGIKPPPGKDAIASNPHLKFLFEELDKARQVKNLKNYADPTREYLNSIKDFLRY